MQDVQPIQFNVDFLEVSMVGFERKKELND